MKFKHGTRRRALEYEKDWVQRWKEDDTFKKSVENRPKDNSYVFYDGPPFITGVPHHGTLLSSIVKDAVPRYWTMKGKRVERRWGWDCHGLPAENFVEKQLGIVDRRQIVASKNSAKDSLKFKPELAELIKRGEKTTTFRYYAKNLKVGDTAELFIRHDASSVDRFGYARITHVTQMPLRDLPLNEYNSKEEQLASYRGYWGKEVALDSMFTVYDFEYLGESLVQAPLDKDGNELPTISLETYIEKARESMVANSATWEGVIDRIGRWVDFKGAYRTMDKDFMESVWWAFKNLYDAGKIYEGEKVLMYDTKFATPVSKAEVAMDNDAYQTVTDPSVFVKFRVKDDLETDFSDCDVVIVKAGVKKDDKVLWVQEKKETAKHLWNMPGGKVEDGEDLETALRREIDEELGLGIKSLRMTKIHRFEDEHGKIAIILYETELLDGEIELEDKLENYGWFSLEEIEKMFASGEVRGRVEVDQAREILEPSHDKKVLFVCHGCVGRSQMAKALYNHYTQTTNAMAAGTDVAHLNPNASTVRAWEIENNRKSSANELMEDLGLSILDSERHQLTPEMLAEYDLVVNTATKAQTPEWFGGSNIVWWNMKDPGFSHTKDEIKAVRDEIDYRVKELIGGHIIDDTSKGLRELSLNDGEKELEFLRQMPQEENGFGRPAKPEDLVDMGSFRQFLSERVARSRGENIAPGRVPDTTYWVVRGDEIVGMVNIRHYLNDALIANAGGHIGIGGVPTKYRGQGIGSDALGMAVQKLHETGTKDILVGAFEDNIASRRMIEKNGGQLEKVVTSPEHPDRKMAVYWIRERSNSPYILAWTTTPWTLPANLMLAVNPEMTYCEVLVGGEKLIIAEEALERVLKDEKNKPLEYEVLRTFPGSELVGKSYEPLNTGSTWPTDEKTRDKIHKVYAADFVSHESGTGIVHVAPAYGEDDFELAKSMGVAPFHVIDDNGYYTDTNYKGLEVWDNNKFIAKDLKEKGIVWKIEYIRHEYPFNPRSKQRIMYRAIPSWFFDIQGSKPLMLEQNENINWFPPHLKHGRFAKNIEQAPDWNLSRDRFWATAMPVWKGDKGTVKVIGSYAELKELSGVELEDYHRPWVDDVTFTIDGEKFMRIDKVLDCWFESGSMPFAQLHYPFENQEKFEQNYPAEFITEYVPQVRAWFYYVHSINTNLAELGAFGEDSNKIHKNAFKNVIVTGTLAGNDGRKMSKSLGNFTDPNVLMDKFSADSLRFLLLSSPLLNSEDFALHDKDVGDVARKFGMVWNMYDFFTMYAEVDGWEFDSKKPFTLNPDNLTNPLDKWIVSRLHQLNEEVTRNMDGYNIPDALSPILPFLDDASNWYVRRSRRRFWKSEDDGDKNDAYRTLHYVLLKLSVILAPFTPFLAEELYQQLGGGNESVHLLDWPTNYTVDEKVVSDMTRTRELINTGLGLRMKKDEHQDSIKVRQPLQFASYAGEKLDDYYEQIMIEELNVKEIHHIDNLNEHVENYDEVNGVIDSEAWLEISKKITPELKREGLMREVIRFVQSARKNAGLNVDDRINLTLTTTDKELTEAITEHHDTIYAETLAVGGRSTGAAVETVKIDGKELEISLEKAV